MASRWPFLTMVMVAAGCGAPLVSCEQTPTVTDANGKRISTVSIDGKPFRLEVVDNNENRFKGLSGRTEIPADGGMLFVFPFQQVAIHEFVMRDCPIDIDIIFLDPSMRITAWHQMKAEAPRSEAEKVNEPATRSNPGYEERLKKYSSKFPAQYAIELKGGATAAMKLKEGQKLEIDPELQKLAR